MKAKGLFYYVKDNKIQIVNISKRNKKKYQIVQRMTWRYNDDCNEIKDDVTFDHLACSTHGKR